MRKIGTLFIFIYFMLSFSLLAFDRQITMGEEDNWADIIFYDNVVSREGRWGYRDLVLEDNQLNPSDDTDLLLHFNEGWIKDEAGHYEVEEPGLPYSDSSWIFGGSSGAFERNLSRRELIPRKEGLFAPGTFWGDFSLEFWIAPVNLNNEESLFSWNGAYLKGEVVVTQGFQCLIRDRQLIWEFHNFFVDNQENYFTLTGIKRMLPGRWYHHLLRFDSTTGMLEYLVDGVPEGVIYVTATGKQDATVFLPRIGDLSSAHPVLCKNYTGLMDEFHLTRRFLVRDRVSKYSSPGEAVSRVFDMEYSGSSLKTITAVLDTSRDTAVYFYYKIADKLKSWNQLAEEWIPFIPGEELPVTRGRYFQVRAMLLPGGGLETTPVLSRITIVYEEDLPPSPPASLRGEAGDGRARLTWYRVNEYDVKGYRIYYGTAPGRYDGENSPLNAGNVDSFIVEGLENGRVYYFTLVAYDNLPHQSVFSREVSVRPSELSKLE